MNWSQNDNFIYCMTTFYHILLKMLLYFELAHTCTLYFQETARKPLKDKLKNFLEVCSKFQPVMRYFFMENFSQPSVWFERRLAYTKSVSTTSIGIVNHIYIIYYTEISVISAQYSTCTSYLFCYSGIHSGPGRPTYTEHFD